MISAAMFTRSVSHPRSPTSSRDSKSCGPGTRTPTSGSRDRRPTIRRARNGSTAQCSELQIDAVRLNQPLLGLRVDVRDDLDVRLEAGSAQLRLQEAVHLEDAGGVVH